METPRSYIILVSFLDDTNRVTLKALPGVKGSDYINASFVDVSLYHEDIISYNKIVITLLCMRAAKVK